MSEKRFQVGQQVYVAWSGRRSNNSLETISKVGTKWATLELYGDRYRFDINTLWIDNGGYGSSVGKIYLSEGDYLREKTLNDLWGQFRKAVWDYRSEPEFTSDAVRTAAKALGIALKEPN